MKGTEGWRFFGVWRHGTFRDGTVRVETRAACRLTRQCLRSKLPADHVRFWRTLGRSGHEEVMKVSAIGEFEQAKFLATTTDCWVGFLDLLGFSAAVSSNFESAVASYSKIAAFIQDVCRLHAAEQQACEQPRAATLRMVSDSIVVTGPTLLSVAAMCQAVQSGALLGARMLLRGGIGFGKHANFVVGDNMYVVSCPLVEAVATEKHAGAPRVVVARGFAEETAAQAFRSGSPHFMQCDDGRWAVVPFLELEEGQSEHPHPRFRAVLESLAMENQKSGHADKYDWMLSQVDRVWEHFESMKEEAGYLALKANREDR